MRYRRLGNSDLHVSEIGIGTWGVNEGIDRERFRECLFRAFDHGINFIDTSNSYASGEAEAILGQILKGIDRSSYYLATKVFFPVAPGKGGLSAREIQLNIDLSLQRLQLDYVDLYQCHRYDHETPLMETMEALSNLVKAGKVRYLGFSEWSPDQIRASVELVNVQHFVSSQPQYSLLWREPEAEVFPVCAAHGIGQIVWSPLAQGILTGKYQPGRAAAIGTRAANPEMNSYLRENLFSDQNLRAVRDLVPIARDYQLTLPQLALAWVLREPSVCSAIIGASHPLQIDENVAAAGVTLDPAAQARIDFIFPRS